ISFCEAARKIGVPRETLRYFMEKKKTQPRTLRKIGNFFKGKPGPPSPPGKRPPSITPLKKPPAQEKPAAEPLATTAASMADVIKHQLLALYGTLSFFRDGTKEDREVFRKIVDEGDAAYLSSLLQMMGTEETFQRWQKFTTSRFQSFGIGGNKGESS
ncbi:MAG: hypothetical protein PHU56_04605, partial [Candidatus Pacebacteria bacterium]|nr:hypothetical protein [Candidatus Paceibacterota bacterium]